jgi:hypothetical protein
LTLNSSSIKRLLIFQTTNKISVLEKGRSENARNNVQEVEKSNIPPWKEATFKMADIAYELKDDDVIHAAWVVFLIIKDIEHN